MDRASHEHGIDADLIKTPATDAFRFNGREQTILNLWDQEQEVRLELNLRKAQNSRQHNDDISLFSDEEVQSEITKAEKDLLEARSKYMLRNQIIQNVIMVDPVLKAVHSGANATDLERRLLPLIIERDTLSMVHSTLSSELQAAHFRLATLEREVITGNANNRGLAHAMLDVANELKAEKVEEVQDAHLRKQLEKLENEVKKARTEWRVMKSLVAGIVAGSGVDWASDSKLLGLVMDEEDELG